MEFKLSQEFITELPADPSTTNTPRQVEQACFSFVSPTPTSNPAIIHTSMEMLSELGIPESEVTEGNFLSYFSGQSTYPESKPYAMAYGGHQFGHWAGQLGDGRAINIMDLRAGEKKWSLQLKGAGPTPYSRTADGLAVLRSSIREHLCSEAMYHLGVPTTRSLSLCLTGDQVLRDVMYNGNAAYEKGAVVCRAAESFLRFGNYQLFASRGDKDNLRKLLDYTIKYHFKEIKSSGNTAYIDLFQEVSKRTLEMVLHWQRVGFVHGVMNTDNMSILGLTIDFGPYGWLEGYDDDWTPNTTDKQFKRYRYGNQPKIALWNLVQFGNVINYLVEDSVALQQTVNWYNEELDIGYIKMMCAKIGLDIPKEKGRVLISSLESALTEVETDMTIFFRQLANCSVAASFEECWSVIQDAFYADQISEQSKLFWKEWFEEYYTLIKQEQITDSNRKNSMDKVNPKYVLRNYMAQLAIDKADQGDYALIEELHQCLKRPYDDQPAYEHWYTRRPEWARHKVGCSMLSCSS
jgi:uncharacterized protein YdiU (UPF0061 family)